MNTPFPDDLIARIQALSGAELSLVLEFIEDLPSAKPRGINREGMKKVIGSISNTDFEEMIQAIEEGCESIDYSEW